MSNRRFLAVCVAAALLVGMTACTPKASTVNEDMTVQEAKQLTMSTERDIAELIPSEYVASVEQKQTGVLLSCDDDRGYRWTGQMKIFLQGEPDVEALLQAVADEYNGREGYEAEVRELSDGEPGVRVSGLYGEAYMLGPWDDRTRLQIQSFSQCFRLPDDLHPADEY